MSVNVELVKMRTTWPRQLLHYWTSTDQSCENLWTERRQIVETSSKDVVDGLFISWCHPDINSQIALIKENINPSDVSTSCLGHNWRPTGFLVPTTNCLSTHHNTRRRNNAFSCQACCGFAKYTPTLPLHAFNQAMVPLGEVISHYIPRGLALAIWNNYSRSFLIQVKIYLQMTEAIGNS